MKLLLLISILYTGVLSAHGDVRIGILSKYELKELKIKIQDSRIFFQGKDRPINAGNWKASVVRGKVQLGNLGKIFIGNHILLKTKDPFEIIFHNGKEDVTRRYEGNLEFFNFGKKIELVLSLPMEKYVGSATKSELGELLVLNKFSDANMRNQLMAAQEIAIRTFITNEKKRHPDAMYDFCDLTHCIHFAGTTNQATQYPNIILTGQEPIHGYFHSTCGGYLSGPEVFWPNHPTSSHFRKGNDGLGPNCQDSPHLKWEAYFSNYEMEHITGEKNVLSYLAILKEKRVQSIEGIKSDGSTINIPIAKFFSKVGNLYGWNKIKSNSFVIEKYGSKFKFKGRGLGHGIGLCQWGASQLAKEGKTFKEILAFYYPGTKLASQ